MNEHIICSRCIMDATARNISFDHNGHCNFCRDFVLKFNASSDEITAKRRDELIHRIKVDGRSKEYDCIVGLSGGIDSSYVLLAAVKHGLRPLAVHLDNGWNSELAVNNIANLVRKLNVDLYTHVIDWDENRDLQNSFIKANVIDIELLMDNAMLALNYQQARKYGIKHILAGTNQSTEGMRMPDGWNWLKFDKKNILSIQNKFGTLPIKTHPLISVKDFVYYEFICGIHWTPFLDYFNYVKDQALCELKNEVEYRPYPYKHYESVFTRFYQAYILPRKFGIDKRKLHLSTLIITGQMNREEALDLINSSPYPDPDQFVQDYDFVIKKLGHSQESFDAYLSAPAIDHSSFKSEKDLWDTLKLIHNSLRMSKSV